MKWEVIKPLLGKVSPMLGTLIGGPVGATIGSLIANQLGVDDTPDAVARAIADPDIAANLQRWAYEHEESLERIALQTLQAELNDKASARTAHKHSKMPAILTVSLTVLVAGLLYMLFVAELPQENKDIAFMLFGQVSALWGASITYWVGTTRSSAEKTNTMNKSGLLKQY